MAPSWQASEETKLISLVSERPNLWRKKHHEYLNTYIKGKTWLEIANSMMKTKEDLQKKWRSLLRRMGTEVRSIPKPKSGDAGSDYESKWIHFKSMSFLRGELAYKASTGNLSAMRSSKEDHQSETDSDGNESPDLAISVSDTENTQTEQSLSMKNLTVVEENRDDQENAYQQENDLLFFRTLIPDMNLIEPEYKLLFRQEITDVVLKYVPPEGSTNVSVEVADDDDIQIVDWRIVSPKGMLPVKKEKNEEYPAAYVENKINVRSSQPPPTEPEEDDDVIFIDEWRTSDNHQLPQLPQPSVPPVPPVPQSLKEPPALLVPRVSLKPSKRGQNNDEGEEYINYSELSSKYQLNIPLSKSSHHRKNV